MIFRRFTWLLGTLPLLGFAAARISNPPRHPATLDPGWYDNPTGTLAIAAMSDELRQDGIDVNKPARGDAGPAGAVRS